MYSGSPLTTPLSTPLSAFVNRNCGSANSARHTAMNESSSGKWRTVRHDAIARVIRDCVREAGFRTKWQPGNLPESPRISPNLPESPES
eukprot:8533702-Pyramimonas_sp.AAC.1